MDISFPGGVAVDVNHNGFTINTDQPEHNGGANSAPNPFDLFLASIGACAGFFALRFCQQRDLSTEGMSLKLETVRDEEKKLPAKVQIKINLPEGFPEKYKKAIIKATDQCAVKRSLLDPPEFEVIAE